MAGLDRPWRRSALCRLAHGSRQGFPAGSKRRLVPNVTSDKRREMIGIGDPGHTPAGAFGCLSLAFGSSPQTAVLPDRSNRKKHVRTVPAWQGLVPRSREMLRSFDAFIRSRKLVAARVNSRRKPSLPAMHKLVDVCQRSRHYPYDIFFILRKINLNERGK